MKETENGRNYYFVDESGDPIFFGRKGKDLLKENAVSPIFMVGYVETTDIGNMRHKLESLRKEIAEDQYLKDIPSLEKSIRNFHAKDDCPEVREKVFKCIKEMDVKVQIIVARKNADMFRGKFKSDQKKLYEYLVAKLFENRLHLHSQIDIYFSKMGNVVRENNMKAALETAKAEFERKWKKTNSNEVRIFIQEPSQIVALQVVDYMLWALFRAYTKGEMRYFNFVKDKYSLVVDIFDHAKYPNIYYTAKNEFDIKKTSPLAAM